jgi:hypothetical protein
VPRNSASADPISIYWHFYRDIADGDEHSTQMVGNREWLIQGDWSKPRQGVIDPPRSSASRRP